MATVYCILDDNKGSKLLCQKLSGLSHQLRKEILQKVKSQPEFLKEIIYEKHLVDVKRDRQLLIKASFINWKIIYFLPETIQYDKQVALLVFTHCKNYNDLKRIYIENYQEKHSLFSDDEWILELSRVSSISSYILQDVLECMGDSPKKNKQLVRNIFKSYCPPSYLRLFDDSIKSDRELISELVKYYGIVLEYADRKFLSDWGLLKEAVKTVYSVIGNVKHRKFVKYWIQKCPQDYMRCNYSMRSDTEIALIALKREAAKLCDVPEKIIDRELLIESLKVDCRSFQWAPSRFIIDKMIVTEAVTYSPDNFQFAHESLRSDKDFILQLIEVDPNIVRFISDPLNDDIDIAQKVVKRKGSLLNVFSLNIKRNENVVISALMNDGTALQNIYPYFNNQTDKLRTNMKRTLMF